MAINATADLHLGDSVDCVEDPSGVPSKAVDTMNRLHEVEQGCEHLIIAGDVSDSVSPPPWAYQLLFDFLLNSTAEIWLIPGNHDVGVSWSAFLAAQHLDGIDARIHIIVEPCVALLDQEVVVFYPHRPKKAAGFSLGATTCTEDVNFWVKAACSTYGVKAADVTVVTHGQLLGAPGLPFGSETEMEAGTAMQFEVQKFLKVKRVVLGHTHKPFKILNKHGTPFYSPGSLVPHNFGEADIVKGYMRVAGAGTVETHFQHFDTPIREYKTVKLNATEGPINLSAAARKKIAGMRGLLVKLIFVCQAREDVNESEVREAFELAGARVLRVEFSIQTAEGAAYHISAEEAILSELNHYSLLDDYLSSWPDLERTVAVEAAAMGREVLDTWLAK